MSKRIYIAGKYDDKDIVSCLSNIRKGLEMASLLMKKGYAVFCPFADFLYAFTSSGPYSCTMTAQACRARHARALKAKKTTKLGTMPILSDEWLALAKCRKCEVSHD